MGLLKLGTFPVSGPLAGTQWVLQTLLDQAERQYYDEGAVRREMAELEARLRAGQISETEFDRREEALFERLLEARNYHRRKRDDAESTG